MKRRWRKRICRSKGKRRCDDIKNAWFALVSPLSSYFPSSEVISQVVFFWWSFSGHHGHFFVDVVAFSFQAFSIFDVSSVDLFLGGGYAYGWASGRQRQADWSSSYVSEDGRQRQADWNASYVPEDGREILR